MFFVLGGVGCFLLGGFSNGGYRWVVDDVLVFLSLDLDAIFLWCFNGIYHIYSIYSIAYSHLKSFTYLAKHYLDV